MNTVCVLLLAVCALASAIPPTPNATPRPPAPPPPPKVTFVGQPSSTHKSKRDAPLRYATPLPVYHAPPPPVYYAPPAPPPPPPPPPPVYYAPPTPVYYAPPPPVYHAPPPPPPPPTAYGAPVHSGFAPVHGGFAHHVAHGTPAQHHGHSGGESVFHDHGPNGFYYSFDDHHGTKVEEHGTFSPHGVLTKKGTYQYISPEGIPISVGYIADEHGFRVNGDHIPK